MVTSDVTRFRGLLAAALAAAAVVAIVAIARSGGASRAPGPLPRSHQLAGVGCDGCHGAPRMADACAGCHGPHASTRGGHAALGCTECHRQHDGHGAAAFAPGAPAQRLGPGAAVDVAIAARFRPVAPVTVPLIAAATCERCHDASRTIDPLGGCVVGGANVCFDEHRPVRDRAGALAARVAAWGAARLVAEAAPAPVAPARRERQAPWGWLGLGLLAGLATWGGVRGPDRLRRRATAAPATMAPPAVRRLPVIDAATCLGCYACVDACPFDVLEIRRYVAVVARPADCCGLTLCEQRCPNRALTMGAPQGEAAPELEPVPGVFLAGDVAGGGLIRGAIHQGALAVERIAARPRAPRGVLDLLIIGAGPAGLSAALEAEARGLRYLALEQGSVAGSIRSFPRGKLVTDPDLPPAGRLWIAEATKEELLARWLQTVRQVKPAIAEGQRVTSIERADTFTIRAVDRDGRVATHRAAHVVVAVGRRGTPRTLDVEVPASFEAHVHYALADARSFAGRRVLVVGLGDVAMEAAVALSRQPGTDVIISYRGDDFRRGKARNIAEVRRRAAAGALRLVWQSQVARIGDRLAVLSTPQGPVEVPCDAVLVLVGSIPPEDLLRTIGLVPPLEVAS